MEFRNLVKKLEKHFGEKAIHHKYNEELMKFEDVWYDENTTDEYNVYIAGYNVKHKGNMILKYDMKKTKSCQVLEWKDGHYGFSHRAGCTFAIGDMIFDEKWVIQKDHPKYDEFYNLALKTKNESPDEYRDNVENYIMDFVPFRQRGCIVIENKEQEFESALNFAKYIS